MAFSRWPRLPLWLLVLLAVGSHALALFSWRRAANQATLAATSSHVLRFLPGLASDVHREVDPWRRALLVARGWLALAFDPSARGQLSPAAQNQVRAALETNLNQAARLALRVWEHRPASGEAAAVAAGLALQEVARKGTFAVKGTEGEKALAAAVELAPYDPEVIRIAGWAALARLPFATPEERPGLLEPIRRVLAEPEGFRLFLPLWATEARDDEEFLSLAPQATWAYGFLLERARRAGAPELTCRLWRTHRELLAEEGKKTLAEAERLLRGGAPSQARGVLLALFSRLPADLAFAGILNRALQLLPPGPLPPSLVPRAREWLELAVKAYVRGENVLAASQLGRLSGSLQGNDTPLVAAVALMCGDPWRAQELAARDEATAGEAWVWYWLARARAARDRGDAQESWEAVDRLPRTARAQVFARYFAALSGQNPAASGPAPSPESRASATVAVPATAWTYRNGMPELQLWLQEPALAIQVQNPGPGEVTAEWWIDGRAVGCQAVVGERWFVVAEPLAPGLHWLELRPLTGSLRPGEVTLAARVPPQS